MNGSSTSGASDSGASLLRALSWSIAVVLLSGVVALFTTPGQPAQAMLDQGAESAVAVGPAGPSGPGVADTPTSTAGSQVPAADQAGPTGSTSPAAPAATRATASSAGPTTSAAPKAAPAPAALRLQPAPGRYPLRISGSSSVGAVPSSGSLVVEPRGGDQLHRTVGVPGDLVLVQRSHAAGVDLVSFSITAGPTTLSFKPPAPLPFIRTQPGSWGWSVQSTDRTVTLNHTATVTSAGPVSVSGAQVPTVRVERVFSVSGANVSGTVRLTSTVSLADRLPLVQHQVINVTGKALGGLVSKAVVSDSTATLTSTTPR